jgi:hypothetical protein
MAEDREHQRMRIQVAFPAALKRRAVLRSTELGLTFSEYIERLIQSDAKSTETLDNTDAIDTRDLLE